MYARFYRFTFKKGSLEEALQYFDEQAKPMIESIDGHLGIKSVMVGENESIMASFYRDKETADTTSEIAATLFEKFAQWLSSAPEVLGEGEVVRSVNLGH
tara:strand:- start:173 stop:472 length:300 start_codon:yes stop_codon:yes gene_type:complete